MRRTSLAGLVAAAGATAVGLIVGTVGGQGADQPFVEPGVVRQAALDHSLKPCGESFERFHVGATFAGLPLVHEEMACTRPEPVRTRAAGGEIDPNSLGRAHSMTYIYGECKAEGDQGCSPPLSIQTWPACERSAADYTMAGERLEPTEELTLRGVPARFYGENRLELSAADETIVLFGDTREVLISAANALRSSVGSPKRIEAGEMLPAPVAGAQEGKLSC